MIILSIDQLYKPIINLAQYGFKLLQNKFLSLFIDKFCNSPPHFFLVRRKTFN